MFGSENVVWRGSLDESKVRRQVNEFQAEETSLDGKSCSERAATVMADDNRQRVDMIRAEIVKSTFKIVEDLDYRKVCASSVNTCF